MLTFRLRLGTRRHHTKSTLSAQSRRSTRRGRSRYTLCDLQILDIGPWRMGSKLVELFRLQSCRQDSQGSGLRAEIAHRFQFRRHRTLSALLKVGSSLLHNHCIAKSRCEARRSRNRKLDILFSLRQG